MTAYLNPRHIAMILISSFSCAATAQVSVEKARQSQTAWLAFQCAAFAEMNEERNERMRLYAIGLRTARVFLMALQNGELPPEVARIEVPIAISNLLEGPTVDFKIGPIYEAATSDAFDQIVKKENGEWLDQSEWIDDMATRRSKAKAAYQTANCDLLK